MAPMIEFIKVSFFQWTPKAQAAFGFIKSKLTQAPILVSSLFWQGIWSGMWCIWSENQWSTYSRGRPLAFFSEKLCDLRRKYSTYDKEFYAIIRSFEHWSHYLVASKFSLHTNHETLKYIQRQHKLNSRHAKRLELLQFFHFIINHNPAS